jgi:Fic family protein
MTTPYQPPFTITPRILALVVEIGEALGRWQTAQALPTPPTLRRGNRLRTIQASLAIEHNSLTLEQVTAVVAGKRVLGSPKEIQEVRNAFDAYEQMENWKPWRTKDLLAAHKLLMTGLVDRPGHYRSSSVGIAQGSKVIHLAPPAVRVPELMADLLRWVRYTDAHPLITSCVFHYEFEFIHPFLDGNGRLGRLWQTLILGQWKPELTWLPVETVIHKRQSEYYQALGASDKAGHSTPFIEFMLSALLQAIIETSNTDQVSDQVTDQVKALLKYLAQGPLSALECMKKLRLSHRPTFRQNYLQPALASGLIERTLPDKPNSRLQKYRLTRP